MALPRFQIRRVAGKVVVSCTPELATYAEELGQKADQLAASDPLLPPLRVFQELYEVSQPQLPHGCQPFGNERLLKLAAAMSRTAAVSSRQELYPRGMAAERALRLGIGALSGLGLGDGEGGFTIEQIRDRLKSRYPEAEPLPNRPELDDLLRKVGFDVRWQPETSTYHRREASILVTSGSSLPRRRTHGDLHPKGGDHPGDGGGPTVRGAAAPRLQRWRVPGAHRPSQPDAAVRGRASAAVPAGAGLVRRPALRRPPQGGRGTGNRLERSSSRPTGRTRPARTGTT